MAGDWDQENNATRYSDNSAAEQDLDAEVARFLLTEFFACSADDDDSAAAPPCQFNAPDLSPQLVAEDLLFMDLLEPLDLPDLELGGVDESPLPDSQMRCSSTLPAAGDITTRDLQPPDSLRVLVPASVLVTPRTSHNLEPLQNDALPRSTMKKPRKRVKDELEYLRQQVKDFEDELEKLQRGSSEEVTSETDSLSFSVHSISQSQSGSWESVAKRQECEKQKAKAENAKLKEALNNQLQLAKSLSRLLETQQDLSWLETPPTGRMTKNLCITSSTEESVFEMLAAQVEMMYSQVDAALCDSSRVGPESVMKSDANGNVFIEFVDTSVLLFDFRTTASAMWKLVSSSTINFGNRQYQVITATDDTARARLSMTLRLRRQDLQVKLSYFGRRFVEADRVVIVWCTMSDSEGYFLVNENERVQVREYGWSVMKAAKSPDRPTNIDDNGGMNQSGTTMQTITRLTLELEMSGASTSEASMGHVGLLTNVVLSLNHQNLATLRQMIENSILSSTAEQFI